MLEYNSCVTYLAKEFPYIPDTVLVLGSGFADYVHTVESDYEISYAELPGFRVPTNKMHRGKLILGRVRGKQVLIMQGRIHYYEGYDMSDIVFPLHVFRLMGLKNVILTNASGGISPGYDPGTLVFVKDHISSFVPNCLRGENDSRFGVRFPDSSDIYTESVRSDMIRRCQDFGIAVKEGIYVQTAGPSFETPAEIKAYRVMGADIVGMSTACEAIAASHAGMKVCCLSCVTNYASGVIQKKLTAEEIDETINQVYPQIETVINNIVDYFAYRS